MAYLNPSAISDLPDGWQPDAVVSMGCEVEVPRFSRRRHRRLGSAGSCGMSPLDFMRNVRNQVEKRVEDFISQ